MHNLVGRYLSNLRIFFSAKPETSLVLKKHTQTYFPLARRVEHETEHRQSLFVVGVVEVVIVATGISLIYKNMVLHVSIEIVFSQVSGIGEFIGQPAAP